MASSLIRLPLSAVTQLGGRIRALGATRPRSFETVATRIVRLLFDEFVDAGGAAPEQVRAGWAAERGTTNRSSREGSRRSVVLARMYLMTDKSRLGPELGAHADHVAGRELPGETRCMALLATAGDRPEWNDRRRSRGHRVLPLPTEQALRELPMVLQMVAQLGIPIEAVVEPAPELVLELSRRSYNVFHVPDALGSPFIPAQDEFVIPNGVRSVVGFGGLLPSGDVFAALVFARVAVPRSVADMFRTIAMNTKVALLSCASSPPFEGSQP